MVARVFAIGVGAVYLLLGTFGFLWTGFEAWVEPDTEAFVMFFRLNPTHNLVHLAIGAALLVAGAGPAPTARRVVGLLAVAYLAVGVAGFFVTGSADWNVLALNTADNWLHVATGAAALAAAAAPARAAETA